VSGRGVASIPQLETHQLGWLSKPAAAWVPVVPAPIVGVHEGHEGVTAARVA